MEVVAVHTSKEHALTVNLALSQLFPISFNGKVYVSFVQDLDKTTLKQLYMQQNQWLQDVQTIMIGNYSNIDRKCSVGKHHELSLCKFMKLQPFQSQKVPINIENSGSGGRTWIIFVPKHANQAKQVFDNFWKCTKQLNGQSMEMEIDGEDSSIQQSNTTSYSAQMEAMLQDNAMAEFLPLTPPQVSRGTDGPKAKKPKKKKTAPSLLLPYPRSNG